MKDYVEKAKRLIRKLEKRFSYYDATKKWFVIYLCLLTLVLLLPPIVKISGMKGVEGISYSLLFSGVYVRSLMVILISLFFLLGWNMSTKFKGLMVKLFALREDEPLVDFAFLWVIMSVFMGIVDTVGVASVVSERIGLSHWAYFSEILLLIGLIWSFISLWMSAKKTSKKTKILNIVDERPKHEEIKQKKVLTHLFDDLDE
ncbi:MAG: hypothetical protein LBG59_03395 [Candidatus Peribacteria bacterium]|jgi:hypothetical protein|nr:hypothetical protein [Candidatus Peribacteria bacterium]